MKYFITSEMLGLSNCHWLADSLSSWSLEKGQLQDICILDTVKSEFDSFKKVHNRFARALGLKGISGLLDTVSVFSLNLIVLKNFILGLLAL